MEKIEWEKNYDEAIRAFTMGLLLYIFKQRIWK